MKVTQDTGRTLVAFFQDGKQIAYGANRHLFVRKISEMEAVAVPGIETEAGLLNPSALDHR